jgi:hypothetical protein
MLRFRDHLRGLNSRMFGQTAVTYEEIEDNIRHSPLRKGSSRRLRGSIMALSILELFTVLILFVFTLARLVLAFPVNPLDFAFAYYAWNVLGSFFGIIVQANGNARIPYIIFLIVRMSILFMNITCTVFMFITIADCIYTLECGAYLIYHVSYFVFSLIVIMVFSFPLTAAAVNILWLFERNNNNNRRRNDNKL